ncbi:MAG: MFS transporter [Actinobacteria bacterium]|nr:MFS transporter [Actinomycetota bacterium]MBV8599912.1 MFS transporter [Actinomycetota bacterium]
MKERLSRKPDGYAYTIRRTLAIYAGLMVTLLLASLDQTIVATALPKIVTHLGGLTQYSWVFTAYMLTSTVTVPVYGRLGDVHGRRPLMLIAVALFLIGSALCGLAQNMTELVFFRGLQGVGAGGLFPLSLAVIGGIVPPRDRGRWQGLIGSVFAASSIIGPAVGGFIVDNWSWRWVFLVNLPIGGVALVAIALTMPKRSVQHQHTIDWAGAGVLAAGTAALLLGLVWGGRDYPWASVEVVGAFVVSVALLALFAFVERRAPEPILPFDALRNPIVAASVVCMALVGMAMFGSISYVPLFVQGVIGTSATSSGVVLTPLMLGAVTTSFLTGQLISRTGRYRWNVVIGPVLLTAGMVLLWRMNVHTTNGQAARNMVIAGIGLGSMMQVFVLSVQNTVARARIGAATALTQFGRQMGATLGVTVMGVVVNHGLPKAASQSLQIHRLPPGLRVVFANALRPAFFVAACVAALVWFVAVTWVKEVPLRRSVDTVAAAEAAAGAPNPGGGQN